MIILDTNVLSELMRPAPEPKVLTWVGGQPDDELFITAITQAEILYGVAILPPGRRRSAISAEAERVFLEDFPHRVLPFNEEAAPHFARISAERRRRGRPLAILDAMIASIAVSRGAVVATRNITDFETVGLRLVNPWA